MQVSVKVVRLARHGSASSFRNAACTAPSIGTFVNSDSTSKDTMISLSSTLSPLIVDTK